MLASILNNFYMVVSTAGQLIDASVSIADEIIQC